MIEVSGGFKNHELHEFHEFLILWSLYNVGEKFFAHCLYIAELRRVKLGTGNFKTKLHEL